MWSYATVAWMWSCASTRRRWRGWGAAPALGDGGADVERTRRRPCPIRRRPERGWRSRAPPTAIRGSGRPPLVTRGKARMPPCPPPPPRISSTRRTQRPSAANPWRMSRSRILARGKAAESSSENGGKKQQSFIHVRARRGEATDNHNLAERLGEDQPENEAAAGPRPCVCIGAEVLSSASLMPCFVFLLQYAVEYVVCS